MLFVQLGLVWRHCWRSAVSDCNPRRYNLKHATTIIEAAVAFRSVQDNHIRFGVHNVTSIIATCVGCTCFDVCFFVGTVFLPADCMLGGIAYVLLLLHGIDSIIAMFA